MNRRSFLLGLGAGLITAPAIVRAGSLMPVKVVDDFGTYSWARESCLFSERLTLETLLRAKALAEQMPKPATIIISDKLYYCFGFQRSFYDIISGEWRRVAAPERA